MSYLGVEHSLTGRRWVGPNTDVLRRGEAMAQLAGLPMPLGLLLDLRLNRIFVTNDVFTLHRSGLKRFEVDFTNNDGSVGGRRDCRDESLQCCPYVVVRSLGQPNLVRKVRPPATVLLS